MNIVKITKLSEGPSKAVFQVYLESDGVEGELKNYVLVDPMVDFDPPLDKGAQIAILQAWYSMSWFDVFLAFDALEQFPSWVFSRDADNYFDFRYFGGLQDKADAEHTGKLYISTDGFAPAGSKGTMVLEFRKNQYVAR